MLQTGNANHTLNPQAETCTVFSAPKPTNTPAKLYVRNFISKHTLSITAFLIPFLLMFIIFIVRGIFPFGERSFLHIDMYHQYFPFLTEFYHKLKSGDSLFYSWNTGIGGNFLALYAYYLASPFNWLCIFVPESYLMEFQSYMVILKIGLCGLTSYYYFQHHFQKETPGFLFFSTFYALSGFMAAYNWNVMWLDCIFLAPLIILGAEQLVKNGTYKLYCITLAMAILSNFYLCIMLCIYLVLYFLLVLLKNANNKVSACLNFTIFSLLAGGISSILLLPEMANLSISEFSGASFPTNFKTYFDLFDVLARHCMDVAVETGLNHWPNIYCGVGVFALLPFYVICKNIPTREKIGNLILLGFLLISFCTNFLSFLWHGFNYPNSLPSRQSYLYILLLLTISAESFLHIKEFTKTELSAIFFGVIVFIILCQKLLTDDAFTDRTFLLTALFLSGYGILLHLYRNKNVLSRSLLFGFLLLFMLEAGLNTYYTSCPTVSRSTYLSDYDSYTLLLHRNSSSDADFKRYEQEKRVTSNDGTLHSYPSASCFSSTVNSLVTAFYEKYGLRSSKVYYTSDGITPFTGALLNVSHRFSKSSAGETHEQSLTDSEGNLSLYQSNDTLPFGYVIETSGLSLNDKVLKEELFLDKKYAKDMVFNDKSTGTKTPNLPLENQNILAKKLGASENIFQTVPVKNSQDTATLIVPVNGHYYGYSTNPKVKEAMVAITDINGKRMEDMTFTKMSNCYILDFGERKKGDNISIMAKDNKSLDFTAYVLKEKPLKELLQKLNTQPFQLDFFSSAKIEGFIDVHKSGYLVFSMPYESGWKIKVDGTLVEPRLFDGMFLSLPITEGHHEITLTYLPTGFIPGVIISLVSLGFFSLCCILDKNKNFKEAVEE